MTRSRPVQLTVEVPEAARQQFLDTPFKNIYTIGVDATIQSALHNFRSEIIQKVLDDHLVPMALAAAREEMTKQSEQFVLDRYSDSLWIEATTPPLQLKAIDDEVRCLLSARMWAASAPSGCVAGWTAIHALHGGLPSMRCRVDCHPCVARWTAIHALHDGLPSMRCTVDCHSCVARWTAIHCP